MILDFSNANMFSISEKERQEIIGLKMIAFSRVSREHERNEWMR